MTEAAAALWQDIVNTEPGDWFDAAARRHLLRLFCEHATSRAAVQELIDRTPAEALCDPDRAAGFEALLKVATT